MNASPTLSLTPRYVVRLLWAQRKLWLVPMVACAVLAAGYSLVAPRYWEASQALVVRQETAGSSGPRPGKFADLYEMRTLQETILELAKSQQVVVATLQEADKRLAGSDPATPTSEDIEKFRKRLKMVPPDGSEFGKTEVFYFCVRDTNRERAIELVAALCRQLDLGLRELRTKRADSLIVELEEQANIAAEQHAIETKRLVDFESKVGPDLGELRMLHSASSGQSDLRQEVVQLETDARKFKTQVSEVEELLSLLRGAENDPLQLIATPNSLLASQPALRRLKDGLVDAQLATAKLSGTRAVDHPLVQAAVEAEAQIRNDLHRELEMAIKGAEVDLDLSRQRLEATQQRLDNLQQRLGRLATERGEYSNRVAAVDNTRKSLDRARDDLSTAKAALAAAHSGSLVTQLDKPDTGPYPVGLSRKVVTAAGAVAGFVLGLGLVFLGLGAQSDRRQGGDRRAVPRPAKAAQGDLARRSTSMPAAASASTSRTASAANAAPATAKKSTTAPTPGALPTSLPPLGGFGGMSLQEALQAAQQTQH